MDINLQEGWVCSHSTWMPMISRQKQERDVLKARWVWTHWVEFILASTFLCILSIMIELRVCLFNMFFCVIITITHHWPAADQDDGQAALLKFPSSGESTGRVAAYLGSGYIWNRSKTEKNKVSCFKSCFGFSNNPKTNKKFAAFQVLFGIQISGSWTASAIL